jgi:hypothetical protein
VKPAEKKPKLGHRGHPKLNDQLIEDITARLKAGNFRETACASVGIASRTLRIWLKRAAKDREDGIESRFTKLSEALDRAEGDAEHIAVQMARKAGKDDWRFWTWWLEHKCNRRWGYNSKEEDKQPASVVVNVITKDGADVDDGDDDRSESEPSSE